MFECVFCEQEIMDASKVSFVGDGNGVSSGYAHSTCYELLRERNEMLDLIKDLFDRVGEDFTVTVTYGHLAEMHRILEENKRLKSECEACQGRGYYTQSRYQPGGVASWDVRDCPYCGGNGKLTYKRDKACHE